MKRPKLNTKAEERTEGDILDKEERQTGKAENPNGTPANSFWDQILWETLFAGEHDFTWQTAIIPCRKSMYGTVLSGLPVKKIACSCCTFELAHKCEDLGPWGFMFLNVLIWKMHICWEGRDSNLKGKWNTFQFHLFWQDRIRHLQTSTSETNRISNCLALNGSLPLSHLYIFKQWMVNIYFFYPAHLKHR